MRLVICVFLYANYSTVSATIVKAPANELFINALSLTNVIAFELEFVNVVNVWHPFKNYFGYVFNTANAGIINVVNAVQFSKHPSPIVKICDVNVIDVTSVLKNEYCPMVCAYNVCAPFIIVFANARSPIVSDAAELKVPNDVHP